MNKGLPSRLAHLREIPIKPALLRLGLVAGAMMTGAGGNIAESRSFPAARNNVCTPHYCTSQLRVCARACEITTTDSANRDHTLQLCRDFCREEDDDCRAYECRAKRR